jgi:hypothetical protein
MEGKLAGRGHLGGLKSWRDIRMPWSGFALSLAQSIAAGCCNEHRHGMNLG